MMKKNAISWLLLLMAVWVLAACGTESENPLEDPDPGSGGEQIENEITSTVEDIGDGTYRYVVTNNTDEAVTFDFTSGQRYDLTLSDEQGMEVFRLSSVSMYTQALGEETVGQGEELQYEFQIPKANLEPGTYTLEVWLTPKEGETYPAQTEHTIE